MSKAKCISETLPVTTETDSTVVQQSAAEPPPNLISETIPITTEAGSSVVPQALAEPSRPRIGLPGRYEDLGVLASGGFGEVHRVRDTLLDRRLVMKLLHPDLCRRPSVRLRFFTEVQITAQLQHPGIVPVHDYGELPDGRLWFTMKEVRGKTFSAVVRELHEASTPQGFGTTASGWTFRRALDALARMAQAVAYAHAQGVFHRDLKPDNLMVGELGEAMVMDWGLARHTHTEDSDKDEANSGTPNPSTPANLTQQGDILGTPSFMPPEQALGARNLHGPHSDVYALGAILYHLLVGHPPYKGMAKQIILKIVYGPPEPVEVAAQGGPPVPAELSRLCARAMSRAIQTRGTAEAFAKDLIAWLDGAQRREQALFVLTKARALEPEIKAMRAQAAETEAQARVLQSDLRPYDPIEKKLPAWELEDEAQWLRREAAMAEATWMQDVQGALTVDPDLPEAHAMLAEHHRAQLIEAELGHREEDAARAEAMLRAHDRGKYAAFLRGDGALTLVTDPPGAEVIVERYVLKDRRLVPVHEGLSGRTPLVRMPLKRGSYLLRIRAPGRAEVRYPVLIERDGHWDGVPPGESEPFPIVLPKEGELGPDECYVPAGWCWIGGDPEAIDSLPRKRIWVDEFMIDRFPVTAAQYIDFLNDLVMGGREADAIAACPRAHQAFSGNDDELEFPRGSSGLFCLPPEETKLPWRPDWPVALIDWHSAMAYARWRQARTAHGARLPDELEREKAARGVDGRLFPWGDHGEPTFTRVGSTSAAEATRESVHDRPLDESPYGVRGLAGNVRDWCQNLWRHEGPRIELGRLRLDVAAFENTDFRTVKGGAWTGTITESRAAARFAGRPGIRRAVVGLRLTRAPNWQR